MKRLAGLTTALTCLWFVSGAFAADIVGPARVVDGDTVEVSTVKIRLNGIDAPESDQLCLNGKGEHWACGIEARDRLLERTNGKLWTCRGDDLDRYGRTLATCFVDGEDIIVGWCAKAGL